MHRFRSTNWPLSLKRVVARSLAFLLFAGTVSASCPTSADQAPPAKTAGDAKDTKKAAGPVPTEDDEVRIGRENAEENDKQVKLVTDAALVERVNRIGQELAAIANKTPIPAAWGSSQLKPFKYSFKVVDDKDVNAYSLPGGFIYVNKGLLDYVRSDDELAGVLAHEITHASHHHMMKLMREQKKITNVLLPLVAIAIIAGGAGAAGAPVILNAANLYVTAKINSYGVDAEKDADHGGLLLLTHSHYNPVGLYSFMLRLAADERSHAQVELGIYRTHPPGPERAAAAKELLDQLNIPIRLSEVDPTLKASVKVIKDSSSGAELAEIRIRGILVCRIAADEGLSAGERGDRIAKKLNTLIDSRLQPFEIRASRDQTHVLIRGVPVLSEADAAAQNKTIPTLVHELSDAVIQLNQKQQLETNF